jgi:hypothetical protein
MFNYEKIIQTVFSSITLLSFFFFVGDALAQEKNVISSCRLITTVGVVERGRCTIKTHIDGNYIMVEAKTPWDDTTGGPDIMRLVNGLSCASWIYKSSKGCEGEFWYGDEWSYVEAEKYEESGKKKFRYSLGTAYTVIYDGSFSRP